MKLFSNNKAKKSFIQKGAELKKAHRKAGKDLLKKIKKDKP